MFLLKTDKPLSSLHSHLMLSVQLVQPMSVQTTVMLVKSCSVLRPELQTNFSDEPSVPSPVRIVEPMVGWLPFGGFEHTGGGGGGGQEQGQRERERERERERVHTSLTYPCLGIGGDVLCKPL